MNEDRFLPGPSTPASQQIRLAAGLADLAHHPRRIRAFAVPAFTILGLAIVVAAIVVLIQHL